jgi:selenocysteine lyase/cysteine desulfurase
VDGHLDPACDEALVERLKAARVIVSFRLGRIRVAPHWHNTPEDIDRFLEATTALGST